jgi:hypothetical protein
MDAIVVEKYKALNQSPKLVETRCVSCGAKFHYFDDGIYKPRTCANYTCMIRYIRYSQHFHIHYKN